MKTNKFSIILMLAILMIAGMLSCSQKNYKMITRIDSSGSCQREIYAEDDSAFLPGYMGHNPYLFTIDSDWQIEYLTDTVKTTGIGKRYNVIIRKDFRSVKELPEGLRFDENLKSFAMPEESLEKKFRWFYTYYTFKGTYANLSDKVSIPADKYMSKTEQALWFQGDMSAYRGMNGMELKAELDDIENAFFLWWSRNVYEESFNAVRYFAGLTGDDTYLSQLDAVKDTVFAIHSKEIMRWDFEPVDICNMFDNYFATNRFTDLFKSNEQTINELYNQKMSPLEDLNSITIAYNLVMPGKLLRTNATINPNALQWKVNAIRLIADDYVLTAESRVFHPWALAITFLLAAIAVYCLLKVVEKSRNSR
ncbi:MAG: hypothetical protein LBN11_04435 [Tannerella sp.]|jgi:hypothetical protein|nr:hypothetical protein [Tannerella sp.]